MPTSSIGVGRTYTDLAAWESAQSSLSGVHYAEMYEGPVRWVHRGESGVSESTADQADYTTESFTFLKRRAYLFFCNVHRSGATPDVPTITGAPSGVTFAQVATVPYSTVASPTRRLTVFRCVPTQDASGTLTIDHTNTNTEAVWGLLELQDVPLTNNGADMVVQSPTNTVDAGSSITGTLSTASSVANYCVSICGDSDAGNTHTQEGGWTEDYEIDAGTTGDGVVLHVASKQGTSDLTHTHTWTGSSEDGAVVIIEIENAGGPFKQGLDISGQTGASASNYMHIRPATGYEFTGDLESGVQITTLDRGTYTPSDHVFDIGTAYTRVEGLNVNRWIGESAEAFRVSSVSNVRIEKCLMWGAGNVNADGIFANIVTSGDKLYVSNCFFGWLGRTSVHFQNSSNQGTVYIYNCTAIEMVMGAQNNNSVNYTNGNYCGLGEDRSSVSTVGITFHIKNTYVHTHRDLRGYDDTAFTFYKGANSSWGNSTNNISSDDKAPGTSAITRTPYETLFTAIPQRSYVGKNTWFTNRDGPDHYASDTWEDAWLNSGAATTNYGSSTTANWGDGSPDENPIFRIDLGSIPDGRVLGANLVAVKNGTTSGNLSETWFRVLRNWVESQVTYNIYSTGNSWATAGASGTGDIETNDDSGGTHAATARSHTLEAASGAVAQGEAYHLAGSITDWVQDAVDGIAPDPATGGGDNLSIISHYDSGNAGHVIRTSNNSDGSRPFLQIWHDTASEPCDFAPATEFIEDSLTDTASTNLENHTGETGATWAKHDLVSGTATFDSSNRVYPSAFNTEVCYYASGTPPSADYSVSSTFYFYNATSFNMYHQILARASTSAKTWYALSWTGYSVDRIELIKSVSGSETVLDWSDDLTPSSSTSYDFRLEVRGSRIRGYVNGRLMVGAVDTAITGAGKAGIRGLGEGSGSACSWTDFYAPGSDLLDAATDLSSDTDYPISVDILGKTRSDWDLGAWERSGQIEQGSASVSLTMPALSITPYVQRGGKLKEQLAMGMLAPSLTDYSWDYRTPNDGSSTNQWSRGADYGTYHTLSRRDMYAYPDATGHDKWNWASTYPKQMNQWVANGGIIVTENDATAPDGTTTADKLDDQSAVARGRINTPSSFNVPNNAWMLCAFALKKQSSVTNNVLVDVGSFGGAFPGLAIDPVTGLYSGSHEWDMVIDHPLDPANWWFCAFMYINTSGADRDVNLNISPAFNDNDPVDYTEEVATQGFCHVWNAGCLVFGMDEASDQYNDGRRGIRINVDATGGTTKMHHYGMAYSVTSYSRTDGVTARLWVRGSANPNGVRLIREVNSVIQWEDPDHDVISSPDGNARWQYVTVTLPPTPAGETPITGLVIRAGINADGGESVGNFVEVDDITLSPASTPALTLGGVGSPTLVLHEGSEVTKSRGGDCSTITDWWDQYSKWSVNAGALRCTAPSGDASLWWNHFVPITRTTTKVEWGFDARLISGTAPSIYMGLMEFTTNSNLPYDGNRYLYIAPAQTNIFTGTETTLSADINTNDTSATLTSTSGWANNISSFVLQYNIENDQSDLPNVDFIGLESTALPVVSGNTVYFENAYTGSTIPSGTKVRQARHDNTHQYVWFSSADLIGTWRTALGRMTGPCESMPPNYGFSETWDSEGDNPICSNWRYGTFPDTTPPNQGWRPTTEAISIRMFLIGSDATTIIEIDNVYVKVYDGDSVLSQVLHSSSAGVTGSLTTSANAGLDIQRVALVTLDGDVSAGEAGPVQFLRPISQITNTNFEDELAGTTNIYLSIDEVTPSDADYVVSNSGSGGTYESGLTVVGDPTSSELHVLKVRAESDGGATEMDATFSIVEGTNVIASWTVESVPSGIVEYEFRMTKEQIDSITDYSDLRWRVVVEPTQLLLMYLPGDAGGTFTRSTSAWEWVP